MSTNNKRSKDCKVIDLTLPLNLIIKNLLPLFSRQTKCLPVTSKCYTGLMIIKYSTGVLQVQKCYLYDNGITTAIVQTTLICQIGLITQKLTTILKTDTTTITQMRGKWEEFNVYKTVKRSLWTRVFPGNQMHWIDNQTQNNQEKIHKNLTTTQTK